MGTTAQERVRELLAVAAHELAARREDVLSSRLVWPEGGLDAADCAAFLLALEQRKAALEVAGWVTTERARFPLLTRSGSGVGVDVRRVAEVGALAG